MAEALFQRDAPPGLVLLEDSCLQSSWPLAKTLLGHAERVAVGSPEMHPPSQRVLLDQYDETLLSHPSALLSVCRSLHDLKHAYPQHTFYLPVQADLFPDTDIRMLEYLADAILQIRPLPSTINSPSSALLDAQIRRGGGKVLRETLQFDIDHDRQSIGFRPFHQDPAPIPQPAAAATPLASFNLGLTEVQRAQKDALLLPFMRMTMEETCTPETTTKPILATDFDDEDPDDDLDI